MYKKELSTRKDRTEKGRITKTSLQLILQEGHIKFAYDKYFIRDKVLRSKIDRNVVKLNIS